MAGLTTIAGVILLLGAVGFLISVPYGIHNIPEGNVGVYFRMGKLLREISDPGVHYRFPLTTEYHVLQVTMQTDKVVNIPCGTSGGIMIYFDKIEVVNRLKKEFVFDTVKNYSIHYDQNQIFSKIHHEVNQFCSSQTLHEVYIERFDQLDEVLMKALQESCDSWAPGIEIIAIRVTKPRIPESVRQAFESMVGEQTKVRFAAEQQRVVEKEAETKRKQAVMEAEKKLAVARIESEKLMATGQAKLQLSQIEADIIFDRAKSLADADFFAAMKQTEAEKLLLTADFLRLEQLKAFSANAQFYLGDQIPAHLLIGSSNSGGEITQPDVLN